MNKILFVINPISGGTSKTNVSAQIEGWCGARQVEGQFFKTTGKNDGTRLSERIQQDKPDVVVACGGDGTLNLTAQQLLGSPIRLGILPLGSANGLATDLCISENVKEALDVLAHGQITNLDMLLINGQYHCLHLSDVGYNARLIQEFEKDASRGQWGYLKSFLKVARARPLAKFHIDIDGHQHVHRGIMATFANAQRYGTGAIVNPHGQLDDGKFETCIFMPWPRWYLAWMSVLFFIGRVDKSRYVKILPGKEVNLQSDRPLPLQVDGELIGEYSSVKVQVLPEKVSVIVPK